MGFLVQSPLRHNPPRGTESKSRTTNLCPALLIIGWSIAARQDTGLVINVLSMAVTRRQLSRRLEYAINVLVLEAARLAGGRFGHGRTQHFDAKRLSSSSA